MSAKQVRAQYAQEYKLEALGQLKTGQSIAGVALVLGIPKASLDSWVRQDVKDALNGAGDRPVSVTAEQMELACLLEESGSARNACCS